MCIRDRHISDERHAVRLRHVLPLRAVDGVVVANVQIRRVAAELQRLLLRYVGEILRLARGSDMRRACLLYTSRCV